MKPPLHTQISTELLGLEHGLFRRASLDLCHCTKFTSRQNGEIIIIIIIIVTIVATVYWALTGCEACANSLTWISSWHLYSKLGLHHPLPLLHRWESWDLQVRQLRSAWRFLEQRFADPTAFTLNHRPHWCTFLEFSLQNPLHFSRHTEYSCWNLPVPSAVPIHSQPPVIYSAPTHISFIFS